MAAKIFWIKETFSLFLLDTNNFNPIYNEKNPNFLTISSYLLLSHGTAQG
jgi:hypothetical protein